MIRFGVLDDKRAAEAAMPVAGRWTARSLYEQLTATAGRYPDHAAISFQLKGGPKDKSVTLTWAQFRDEVTRTANLLHALGVGPTDVVAYILPNGLEAPVTLIAGATAGIVNPINPLLAPETIGALLRETGAKVVVTLAPFPKTDLAQQVDKAVALAPDVKTVLQVDLARYLAPPTSWIAPLIRPKLKPSHKAQVLDFAKAVRVHRADGLDFAETLDDRYCAYFHTGGTTGTPKVAQHRASGMLYNGWIGSSLMFTEADVLMCPLPMFHVLAAYPVFMSCLMSGAHVVFPTPQGYRGQGVIGNFWKLVERYGVTFMITVPTAVSALMQRKIDADVSSLRLAISGSAAMPVELFHRFEESAGVKVLEGYGMTEATCLVSINPPHGERKIGSVGLPFPYTDVRILHCDGSGAVLKECGIDEIGEICVRNPGVGTHIYTDDAKNRGLLVDGEFLRTGDLGRLDADGYLWITGRAKDLIIRGGHNIDPAVIEEALMTHPAVAFAGAIGQPDIHAGEVPAVYVELVAGAETDSAALMDHLKSTIDERAAMPRHVEVLGELPKTAVGKVFKPDLRRRAITRTFDHALESAGIDARVAEVVEDKKLGLVAVLSDAGGARDDEAVGHVLGRFTVPWRWDGAAGSARPDA